jgi:hypothetical protein
MWETPLVSGILKKYRRYWKTENINKENKETRKKTVHPL